MHKTKKINYLIEYISDELKNDRKTKELKKELYQLLKEDEELEQKRDELMEDLIDNGKNIYFYYNFEHFEQENEKDWVVSTVWNMTEAQKEEANNDYYIIDDYDNGEINFFEDLEDVCNYLVNLKKEGKNEL